MTFSRREEILSKDILLIKDVQELNGMTYQVAARLIRNIKSVMKSVYDEAGRIATSDYIRYFEGQKPKEDPKPEKRESIRQQRKTTVREIPLFRAKEYATNKG